MAKPAIIVGPGSGYNNENLEAAQERLKGMKQYQDLNTVVLTPTRGMIPARVVQSWMFMIGPANSKLGKLFCEGKLSEEEESHVTSVMCQGLEVGDAYNSGITTILNDPFMGNARYFLTLEDDNIPPHDGLIKLYENICDCDEPCKEHFTVVGGLYWMKGEMGQPMVFGDPKEGPSAFQPQIPQKDTIMEVNGCGMGFTLFHSGLFKIEELKPWFVTKQTDESNIVRAYTQDLYFMEKLRKLGYRIAVDTRVKVGHYDWETEMVW